MYSTISLKNDYSSVSSIEIDKKSLSLKQSEGYRFQVIGFNRLGQKIPTKGVVWSVDPPSIGTINNNGYFVTKGSPGDRGTIKATYQEHTATASVDIITLTDNAKKRVVVSPSSVTLELYSECLFDAKIYDGNGMVINEKIHWSVDPDNIGTINDNGRFVATGSIGDSGKIYAKTLDGALGFADIIISSPNKEPVKIVVIPKEIKISVGSYHQFFFKLQDSNNNTCAPKETFYWSINNQHCAFIDEKTGLLFAKRKTDNKPLQVTLVYGKFPNLLFASSLVWIE
ncbi:MAG TPA: Ig-like domain-containing protein [Caldisericia bacterium]|nr:Ig-like domain-containing protein [Caldisericia bacterium]HPI84666.1 Ig-like domain-containing protein [Caldisericia bacterium]HPQ93912.1 Ig-like domain-containing protein [Caldisericia bacterium]